MGYDLRYEAVCKYTEDGINQSKDFVSFVKKRLAIEAEYTKALSKLCKSYERQGPSKRTSKKMTVTPGEAEVEKAAVERTSLQQGLFDVYEEVRRV